VHVSAESAAEMGNRIDRSRNLFINNLYVDFSAVESTFDWSRLIKCLIIARGI
jgi:hypothetical protein